MKTIIIFVFGLLSWLLLTNYQLVYSKVTSFTNPVQESIEEVASADTSTTPTASIDLLSENTTAVDSTVEGLGSDADTSVQDDVSSLELELIEKTESIADETSVDIAEASNKGEELVEELDEKLETAASETESEEIEANLENNSESNLNNKVAAESNVVAPELEQETGKEVEQEEPKAESETTASYDASTPENNNNPGMQQPRHPSMGMPAFNQSMMNPAMMNPGMFMNPMAMMMSMMGPMMNPAMMMNPNAMLNHPMNTMTQPQNMNAMMRSMNPNMMFGMFGQPSKEYLDGEVPDQLPVITIPGMPTQTFQYWPANKVSPGVSREAKKNAFQTAMAVSPLSMRDMMGIMAEKMPVEEGISWDDAIEAMMLRANEVNFKFVGSSKLWKEIEAVTGKPSTKVEMFRFCDAAVARRILDVVPEFIIFLPCKIALMEDGEGKLWVMTMDWDVSWLDYSQNPNSHLAKNIREDAQKIRENMRYIMEGAATGDF